MIKLDAYIGDGPHHPSSLRAFLAALPERQALTVERDGAEDFVATALVLEMERQGRDEVVRFTGGDVPVVTNIFGSRERICAIAGARDQAGFSDLWMGALAAGIRPEVVAGAAPVQEVVVRGDAVDAGKLPISQHFRDDAGRYIGSGVLICKDPDSGVRNLSYQRLQLKGPALFGASLHSRGHIWEHLQRCKARGRNLPVAVVIGVHPAINLAASAKVAIDVDELDIACGLIGQPIPLARCLTIDVEVPAHAEYVIEGEILCDEEADEGPYGEYTGYSTFRSTRNLFRVSAITHRRAPVFHDIIPGYSQEHLLLARAPREAIHFARLREAVPQVTALTYPKSGTHFHAYVTIAKTAEGQARQALMALFGLDPYVKLAIAIDPDIDATNDQEVLWALATRFQADTDMFMVPGVLCNRLDPSSRQGMAAKMGLDATMPADWDGQRTALPDTARQLAALILKDAPAHE